MIAHIEKGYESIKNSFEENFKVYGEIGAALCVYHKNRKVIDIWGGYKDLKQNEKWNADTVVPIFSTTKVIAAACLAICHSKGLFRYSDLVSKYWPEFGENGKSHITIEQLLQHRAGLSAIDEKLNAKIIKDRTHLMDIIASQEPQWQPGNYQGYHVWTIGWYISALLSKIDPEGRFLKEFVETEILNKIEGDIRVGLDEDYNYNKIADLKPFSKLEGLFSLPAKFVLEFIKPWSLTFKSMLNPSFVSDHKNFNKREILQLEIGSGGGVGNARGLATLLDALSDNKHPLSLNDETFKYITSYPEPPNNGWQDKIFKQDSFRFHGGFMKPSATHDFSPSKRAFGGFGAGGSFAFQDPDHNLTIAYVMNKMSSEIMKMEREMNIRKSIYALLEEQTI